MSTSSLYRLSGAAALLAAICVAIGSLLANVLDLSGGPIFNFFGFLFGLFGITGLYLWQREQSGLLGGVGYIVLFIGFAFLMSADFFGGFVLPVLSGDVLSQLRGSSAAFVLFGSGLVAMLGVILFSVSVIRAGIFPRLAAVFLVIGLLATPLGNTLPMLVFVGSLLVAVGIGWWGLTLWSLAGQVARGPA